MATLQKKYTYKISRRGISLGTLQNVVSEFNFSQNINSAGTSMQLVVQQNAFTAPDAPDTLITESGDDIITESGDIIATERTPDFVGNSNSLAMIRSYNDVKVYEESPNNPNGKLVFNGYISRWKAVFGGANNIEATVLSYGAELDNYLIQGAQTVDVSQASSDATYQGFAYGKGSNVAKTVQSFQVGGAISNLIAIEVKLAGVLAGDIGQTMQMDLYSNLSDAENGANSLGSAQIMIQSLTPTVQKVTFAAAIGVTAGGTYYWKMQPLSGTATNFSLDYQDTDVYAAGQAYYSDASVGGGGGGGWTTLNYDFYFKTYYTANATSSPFTSTDPTAILRTIIDNYVSGGGTINYASGTTVLTGQSRSYTFKINTVLEGIQKCLELAPFDWYWYVDPATNTIYFKEASTTADLTMILGRHIKSLDMEANVVQLINLVYFSGGDVGGGVNLFTSQSDATSLTNNKVGIARLSDNRVTSSPAAVALMTSFLNRNSSEVYNTTIEILETTYDITTISLGQVMGFAGFGNFVDQLLLQVVGLTRYPDSVQLKLGVLQKRATAAIEDALRDLNDLQTINNPSSPS